MSSYTDQQNRLAALSLAVDAVRAGGGLSSEVVRYARDFYDFVTGAEQPVNGFAEPDVEAEVDDEGWEVTHHGPYVVEMDDISELPEKLGDIFKLIQQERQFQEDDEPVVEEDKEDFVFPGSIFNQQVVNPPALPAFLQKFAGIVADALEKKIEASERREDGNQ